MKFGSPVQAYLRSGYYLHDVKTFPNPPAKNEGKIVRPQILMIGGEPAWLYAPIGSRITGHKYTQSHVYRILSEEEAMARRKAKR